MSHNSSPGHASPSALDSFYDTAYTAEISSKMRVPDKICIIGGADPPDLIMPSHSEVKSNMNVPERIIVAGDNKHIAMRESLPELKFDTPFPINLPNLVLAPPPNVLTVDEYPYPAVEIRSEKTKVKKPLSTIKDITGISDLHETSLNTSVNADDELTKLHVQIRQLSRRVLALEQETQQRHQREIVLYIFCGGYIILKSLRWLYRQL